MFPYLIKKTRHRILKSDFTLDLFLWIYPVQWLPLETPEVHRALCYMAPWCVWCSWSAFALLTLPTKLAVISCTSACFYQLFPLCFPSWHAHYSWFWTRKADKSIYPVFLKKKKKKKALRPLSSVSELLHSEPLNVWCWIIRGKKDIFLYLTMVVKMQICVMLPNIIGDIIV